MQVQMTEIKPHIGAIVETRRDQLLDEAIVRECGRILEQRSVLVFPRLGLSEAEQLEFAARLGEYVSSNPITLDPELVTNPEITEATFFWHMDGLAFNASVPSATLLTAQRLARKGGQTDFVSTFSAYDALPEAEKAELDGLQVVHSIHAGMRPVIDTPSAEMRAAWDRLTAVKEHPLVWTHPSGRKSLAIGASADRIVGMSLSHGRALLARLLEWATQPQFQYRHDWREGDLVIWHNCSTLHRVVPYDAQSGRLMFRTAIAA